MIKKIRSSCSAGLLLLAALALVLLPPALPVYAQEDVVEITEVEVSVTAPVAGQKPDFDPILPAGAPYTIGEAGVDWSNETDNKDMSSDDVFESGKDYSFWIDFSAEPGYRFSDLVQVFVNNELAAIEDFYEDYIDTVYGFTIGDEESPIDTVEVSVTAPLAGQKPDFNFILPAGANYEVIGTDYYWLDLDTGVELDPDDTFQLGKAYELGIHIGAKEGFYFDEDDLLGLVNGEGVHVEYFSDDDIGIFYIFTAAPDYRIIKGANGSWQKGSAAGLEIACDGDFAKFQGLRMDGSSVPAESYIAADGSTVITLKAAYLDTLAPGPHTLEIVYRDGSVSTDLTILAQDAGDPEPGKPAGPGEPAKPSKPGEPDGALPQTSGSNMMLLYAMLLLLTGAAVIGIRLHLWKQERNCC